MSDVSEGRGWRSTASVIRLAVGLAILALLFVLLPRERIWTAIRSIPLSLWLIVVAGYLAGHSLGMMKYRMMVNLGGAELSYPQAAQCYFGGLFGTLFLPSIVGGDVVRVGVGLRMARHRAGFLLGSLIDRLMDVLALALTAAAGAVLLPEQLSPHSRRIFLLAMGAITIAIVGTAAVFAALPARRFSFHFRRNLARLRQAGRSMRCRPHVVLVSLAGGVAVQSSFVLLTAVLAGVCGLHLRLPAWFLAWPLAKLAALLPISQAGLGVREAALAALLVPFGAPPALTVAVGLVWQTVIYTGGLLSGLLGLLARRISNRGPAQTGAPAAGQSGSTGRL
ncbi:MAG TPA: lysylphosphatidylglycerol synthase transmembrane domain-containing protein [Candidatus Acidoferrales bacterium]|nr:lysylphosphatidylglycerol synthase transmembrane domain-containing protein [Candidatus Acidoferrales bacterium]